MLVPAAARGRPLQFHTTKRTLLVLISLGVGGLIVSVPAVIYIIGSAIAQRGKGELVGRADLVELSTTNDSLREENRMLHAALKAQVRQTEERIGQVNRLIGKISELTGLPLEAPATTTTVLTSGSVQSSRPDNLGRGGPLVQSLLSDPSALLGHGARGYRRIREIQIYQLDSVVYRLDRAARHFGEQRELLKTTPLICPVQGEYIITDPFGNRIHPLYGRKDFHYGVDLAAAHGTPIIVPADGVVTDAGYEKSKGRTLTIDHGMGLFSRDGVPSKRRFRTRYYHCSKVLVKKGARVKRGDVVALVGSTGTSTGNHLHYEVLVDGTPVDPEFFILNGL